MTTLAPSIASSLLKKVFSLPGWVYLAVGPFYMFVFYVTFTRLDPCSKSMRLTLTELKLIRSHILEEWIETLTRCRSHEERVGELRMGVFERWYSGSIYHHRGAFLDYSSFFWTIRVICRCFLCLNLLNFLWYWQWNRIIMIKIENWRA